ncbi:MAG: hypothetical protein R3Y35_11905 [Clostridia bacterium]
MFIYPDNLKSKATLWMWQLRDATIVVGGVILSVFALVQTGILIPMVITVVYAILSIQVDGISILNLIQSAFFYFLFKQQRYDWKA